jgi:hypothetical protein
MSRTAHERLIDHLRNAETIATDLGLPEVAAQAYAARKQALADLDTRSGRIRTDRMSPKEAAAWIRSQSERHLGLPGSQDSSIKDPST